VGTTLNRCSQLPASKCHATRRRWNATPLLKRIGGGMWYLLTVKCYQCLVTKG